jgi:homoserine kinase type II
MSMTSQPELAMLWERTDPDTALADRFGFTDPGQATAWLADLLAGRWGIRLLDCERLVISAGNVLAWLTTDAGCLVAKCSVVTSVHARLAEVARLLAWLGDRGLPVSAPIPALDGSYQLEADGKSIGLQRELSGVPLDVGDKRQVTTAGATLGELHLALAGYPVADPFSARSPRPHSLSRRVAGWLESEAGRRGIPGAEQLRERLRGLESGSEPSVQLVHNDFRSANVLWYDDGISAVIDFDETGIDCCVADLVNASVLLGTKYHNWAPIPPDTQATFLAGYQSVRRLSELEAAWLDTLLLWRTLCAVPPGEDPAGWARSAEQLARGRQ